MNTRIILFAITLITGLFFASCEKENEVTKPVITIHELGGGDSHGSDNTAKIGDELHMDIDVVAEGTINIIQVIIHPEGEDHKAVKFVEWEIDSTYTKFAGLKNTTFHEHIDIDSSAQVGEYHFDFIVTDMEGNQSSTEAELQLIDN